MANPVKISRPCAFQLMSKALRAEGLSLFGVLPAGQSCRLCLDQAQLQACLDQDNQAIIFYNQAEQALSVVEQLQGHEQQAYVEIFQETEGVFGLRAYRKQQKILKPEPLLYL